MIKESPKFFADTSDPTEIAKLLALGIFSGITTNPLIVAQNSRRGNAIDGYRQLAEKFSDLPISIQLLNEPLDQLLESAKTFAAIARNIIVKVPMYGDGRAVTLLPELIDNGIKTNVTGLMTAEQALSALVASQGKGPNFVSLFLNRIKDGGGDPLREITRTRALIEHFGYPTEIIVGSIRQPSDVLDAVMAGAHIVTITPGVAWRMINHPKSNEFIEQSQVAWDKFTASPSYQ